MQIRFHRITVSHSGAPGREPAPATARHSRFAACGLINPAWASVQQCHLTPTRPSSRHGDWQFTRPASTLRSWYVIVYGSRRERESRSSSFGVCSDSLCSPT